MDNKALGIKILKSTVLFTGKAAWFLLCKACLLSLLIIEYIVKVITSSKDGDDEQVRPIGHLYDEGDIDNPCNPISPFFFPDKK